MLKNHLKVLLIVVVILSMSFSLMLTSHASTLVFHFQQPSLSGISGYTADEVSGIPYNKVVNYAYGLGACLNNALSWNVVDFTNISVPSPNTNYQRGVSNTWYGSTAAQASGTSMGFQVHKDSGLNANPAGWIYGMQMAYSWNNWNIKPWKNYGSTAKMRLQSNFWIKGRSASSSSVVQYGQLFVSLVDTVHSKSIWFCISLWDSRGMQNEHIVQDTGGTSNCNVVTRIYGNSRYCSPHPNSQYSDGSRTGTWYCAYVSRQNLINAVTDINNTFSQNYSTNPDDYAVNFIGCGPEMYSPQGTTGWIGAGQSECMLLTEY